MKRTKEFSTDQKYVMSKKLRRSGYVVLEEISNDILVKNTDINLIIRDYYDYEYEIKDVVKLIKKIRFFRRSRIINFLFNRVGLVEHGKEI